MKNRLITIATPNIIYEASPLIENQREYCEARSWEHLVVRETHWPRLHPSFGKVWEIRQALADGCEFVCWADADVAFMDRSWQIADLVMYEDIWLAGYMQANWTAWPYMCWGLTVWRNCTEARDYISRMIDSIENGTPYINKDKRTDVATIGKPWEQWLADELNRFYLTEYRGLKFCSAHEIGCFSRELWNDGVLWEDGMPTVHFAGDHSWADRRQTYIDHYSRLVKR